MTEEGGGDKGLEVIYKTSFVFYISWTRNIMTSSLPQARAT